MVSRNTPPCDRHLEPSTTPLTDFLSSVYAATQANNGHAIQHGRPLVAALACPRSVQIQASVSIMRELAESTKSTQLPIGKNSWKCYRRDGQMIWS